MTKQAEKPSAPVSKNYDLGTLSQAGVELTLSPSPQERAKIAEFLDVGEVKESRAKVELSRKGDNFAYHAELAADLLQACVVTLEPLPSKVALEVERRYRLAPKPGRKTKIEDISPVDDDEPELLEDSVIDLYAPLLEEMALGIDPYPRAPGAAFSALQEGEARESPFAALKNLKEPNT